MLGPCAGPDESHERKVVYSTGASQRSSEGERRPLALEFEIHRREVMGDEDGVQSEPSRVRRVTGKAEEGAGNDQGPATTARW